VNKYIIKMKFYETIKSILEKVESIKELESEFHKNPNVKSFIKDLLKICETHDINLDLKYTEKVDSGDGMKCNGYFHDDNGELVVATKNPLNLWLRVLVHESCHLDQYIENNEWFKFHNKNIQKFNEWLINPENELEDVKKILTSIIEFELDCERRSLKKIKKYDLPIDIKQYVKESNEYLFSYVISLKTKKWDDGSKPMDKKVRESMPDHLLDIKDYINPNNPILKIIDKTF